jgi:hypothetical protein
LGSIAQVVGRLTKLLFGSQRVPAGRVEIFVPQDLGKAHQIIAVVGQELMSHCVPQQVRMNLESAKR